jgi:hypothetical protein
VREFAAKQNASANTFLAVEEVDVGMGEMSENSGWGLALPPYRTMSPLPAYCLLANFPGVGVPFGQ